MMNTEQFDGHTPGPWFPPDFGGEGLLDNKGRVMALLVYDEEEPQTSDEWLANAQLIAAAPDLLAEVKRLHQAFLIATGHIGWGNHLGHNELRHALNSVGIDADSLSWADGEWSEEE